jgi:hypothetical protein
MLLLTVISLLFAFPAIRATTLARLSLDQLAGAADGVARVRCAGTESRWEQGSIWTITTFDIVQTMKGDLPPRIVVRLPGGKVGPFVTTVEGTPKFSAGEEAIVFLERSGAAGYSVAGWVEGTFRVALDARTHREMVTQDSSAFALFDVTTRTFRTEGIRKMPIEIFRARLDTAIAKAQEKTR